MYGYQRGLNHERNVAPLKVGDKFDVKIESIAEKGDGIAKKDGFVLFVPNTQTGDKVKVRVTKVLRRFGFAEVVEQTNSGASKDSETSNEKSADNIPEDSEDF